MAKADYPDKHPSFAKKTIPLEGKTLVPVFEGKLRKAHENLYWHWSSNKAVRQGDWKLAWDKHAKAWELYDLRADRTEAHDLAPEHPELVASLIQKWEAWARMTDVKMKK